MVKLVSFVHEMSAKKGFHICAHPESFEHKGPGVRNTWNLATHVAKQWIKQLRSHILAKCVSTFGSRAAYLKRVEGDQHVETHLARLLCAMLTCGCIRI